MKDLEALAFMYEGCVGTGIFTRQHSYSYCSVHLRLINAKCVNYSDRVLPNVSTPVDLTSSHEKISQAFLHILEVMKAWEQGYSA